MHENHRELNAKYPQGTGNELRKTCKNERSLPNAHLETVQGILQFSKQHQLQQTSSYKIRWRRCSRCMAHQDMYRLYLRFWGTNLLLGRSSFSDRALIYKWPHRGGALKAENPKIIIVKTKRRRILNLSRKKSSGNCTIFCMRKTTCVSDDFRMRTNP